MILTPPKARLEDPTAHLEASNTKAFEKAYARYEAGDQAKARMEFRIILRKNRAFFPAFLAIGYTYLAEDNLDVAERYVTRSLEDAPDYPQAHYAMSLIREGRQDYDGALAELDRVAVLQPEYPGIAQSRNIMKLKAVEKHVDEGRRLAASSPAEALAQFKAARELAPEVPQITQEIARVLISQGNCEEAIDYLRAAAEQLQDDVETKTSLAQCLEETDRYAEALEQYESLLALAPDDAQIRDKIASTKKILLIRSLPDEYQRIPQSEQLNRAQTAALLVLNLPFLQTYTLESSEIITDTIDHWARPYIQKVVDLGILEQEPNRTFQPARPVTRLEMAKAVCRILEILNVNEGKEFPTVDEPPVIPDIPPGNIYYPLISRALASRAMSLDVDGLFHMNRPVTGAEALSIVNRLKTISE